MTVTVRCAAVLAAATILPAALAAQDAGQDRVRSVAAGAGLYQTHCATCHGIGAEGDGPMAGAMMIPPPDLTRLAARNDGVLPVIRIVTRIDGRDPLVSHGSPMPVYGSFFEGRDVALRAETGQPILTSQPISDLLAWLEAVQQE